jgi:hypothetical protein
MAPSVRELAFTAVVVLATVLGLSATMVGLFLDPVPMAAVVVCIVAGGTLLLETARVPAGLLGGLTALLGGIVGPLAVLELLRTADTLSVSLLVASLVVVVGLGSLRMTVFRPQADAGPHA